MWWNLWRKTWNESKNSQTKNTFHFLTQRYRILLTNLAFILENTGTLLTSSVLYSFKISQGKLWVNMKTEKEWNISFFQLQGGWVLWNVQAITSFKNVYLQICFNLWSWIALLSFGYILKMEEMCNRNQNKAIIIILYPQFTDH